MIINLSLGATAPTRAAARLPVALAQKARRRMIRRAFSPADKITRRAKSQLYGLTSLRDRKLRELREAKADRAKIKKVTEAFDLRILNIKLAANNKLADAGLPPAFDLGAAANALIAGTTPAAGDALLRKLIAPYRKMFTIAGFSDSLLELDPKKPLPYKAPPVSKIVSNLLPHLRVYADPANKVLNIGRATSVEDAINFIEAQGYPTALLAYSKLDEGLPKFLKFAAPATVSTFAQPVMASFLKSPYTNDGLLDELAKFMAGLSKDADNAEGLMRTMPSLKALPAQKDTANWVRVAQLYLSYCLDDAKLRALTLRAMPKTMVDLKLGVKPRNGVTAAVQKKTAASHAVAMLLTIILHRVLAGLMHFSKKAKWSAQDATFVGRVVNAYATMMATVGAGSDGAGMFPSISTLQLFYLRSKSADAMLTKSGINAKFATLIKPYATVPSVKTLYDAASAKPNAAKTATVDFVVEKPKRLTAKNVSTISPGQLAWMLANDPLKLLDLYGESPQFDLDFSSLRAQDMRPLAKYLSTSDAYANNIPAKFSALLVTRWGVAPIKADRIASAMATLSSIGIENVARLAEFKVLNSTSLKSLISKFDEDASRYLALHIIEKSRTAVSGAFGKISAAHAKFNAINPKAEVQATDLTSGTKEELLNKLGEATMNIDDAILDAGHGAATVTEFSARVKAAFKGLRSDAPDRKMKVTARAVKPADLTNILASMSYKHGIAAFKVEAAFDVETGATPRRGGQTVTQAWHGTDLSAASCIALLGFRVGKSNIKAGRSMGDVVYVAPNADKSMQYLSSSFSRSGSGVLFVGPAYVAGTSSARAKANPPKYSWTHTGRFATEEIGLTDANLQYDIQSAYAVTTMPSKWRRNASASSPLRSIAIDAANAMLTTPAPVVKAIGAAKSDDAVVALMAKYGIALVDPTQRRGTTKFTIK